MGETTNISWAESTWNPWIGCIKVSSGCKHCYMYRQETRFGRDPRHIRRSKTTFDDPLKWKTPKRVFTCSLSDFFIEKADAWRAEAWEIIRQTPQHIYKILTKRPENIADRLPADWLNKRGGLRSQWNHVWLGVSAEDQDNADARIPVLLSIPASVHFVSCEPLLGPIDLESYFEFVYEDDEGWSKDYPGLDWVIVGGESGPHQNNPKTARPLKMEWVRSLRDQCEDASVPFFFKQDADVQPGQREYIVEEDGSHTVCQQLPEIQDQAPFDQLSLF